MTTTSRPDAALLIKRAIEEFVKQNSISVTSGGRPLIAGKPATEARVLDLLRLYAVDQVRVFKRQFEVQLVYHDFIAGWNLSRPTMVQEKLDLLRAKVVYDETSAREGRSSLLAWMQGTLFRAPTDLEVAVMLHFIWQIKRKLFGKPASYHMMPVFVSAQGTGKTTSILRLIAPLAEVSSNTTLEQFTDQRSWATLDKTYIKVVDEMARAEKTDMATLKMALSAEGILEYRPMRSNDMEQVIQNNTFIGTSNEDISMLIKDYTGARRFFQMFGCMNPVHTLDPQDIQKWWGMTTSMNALAIWKSVDENLGAIPEFKEHYTQISMIQKEELQTKSSFEEFMEMPGFGYSWATEVTGKKFTARDIYASYVTFCEQHGLEPRYSAISICKLLKRQAPPISQKTSSTRQVTFFLNRLPENSISGKVSLVRIEGGKDDVEGTSED